MLDRMWPHVLLIVSDRDFVAVEFELSVTRKVTEIGPPAVVGVPEICPPEESVSPGGSVPVELHVRGDCPPLATNW